MYNKRLNSDNVMLSWFWQKTQKAMPTHCVLGGRWYDSPRQAEHDYFGLNI
ncbi:hypothetical protein [Shewanella sp. UCD-FRSSP16_17]|uniref:hypothetical protein n=1 Tax=Shewanella sp. UCD-FRSSP16_17 TaxID=1853256 RepID=UPI000AF60782|nr:hypothetical protein [Shewanella sp. UCD-FRSSP16_17]